MNCIKRLGERVMARSFERQVSELHIRAATILNRFTDLGRPQTAAVAWPGFKVAHFKFDLCNSAIYRARL